MSEKVFNKVLAANRGEIAVRIFRACYDLGIHTVAMYSKEDELSLFRTRADEAYLVGENKSPLGAYLDIPEIIDLAKRRGVDAIHPGYGFLSENADFARACEEAGITFIGPPSDVLGKMGDKLSAKQIAMECGVPVIPGCSEPLRDGQEALEKAISFGFPVILKAAAGGGGRGMRLCEMPEDVIPAFELVKNEARKAFGNDDIFIEKYLVQPKHIEVQILADQYGNVRHLGERDCSLQRRYQKVVEFAPAWSVPESIREQLHADAVKIAEAVGYVNAGTVEFLVDRDGNHYFIEMNPRIQVEHTVTEMVTSIDLVRAQILIAEGQPISHPEIGLGDQNNLKVNGYAIQCRVTTEDLDTSGAFCGEEAEERGQGQAIADNLMQMMGLETPIITIVIGEGGSGGALAMAVADEVWMLENSIYSILSPEGFASILWKDSHKAKEAAAVMRLTAADLQKHGMVERVFEEPEDLTIETLPELTLKMDRCMKLFFRKQLAMTGDEIAEMRYRRFRAL